MLNFEGIFMILCIQYTYNSYRKDENNYMEINIVKNALEMYKDNKDSIRNYHMEWECYVSIDYTFG